LEAAEGVAAEENAERLTPNSESIREQAPDAEFCKQDFGGHSPPRQEITVDTAASTAILRRGLFGLIANI